MYFSSLNPSQNKLIKQESEEIASLKTGEFLTTNQVARLLGISPSSLEKARSTGHGPYACLPYHKIGRSVRYRRADIESFLDNQRITGVARR